MHHLLTNPDRFFAEDAPEMGFRWPMLVVLFVGLSMVGTYTISITSISKAFNIVGNLFLTVALIVGIVGTVGGGFVLWLLFAGLSYTISLLFDAEGDFRILLKYLGWCFVPIVLSGVIATTTLYLSIRGVAPPEDPSAVERFIGQIRSNPLRPVSIISGIVLTFWQGFLAAFAVKHALDVSFREAVLIVLAPMGLMFLSFVIMRLAPSTAL